MTELDDIFIQITLAEQEIDKLIAETLPYVLPLIQQAEMELDELIRHTNEKELI